MKKLLLAAVASLALCGPALAQGAFGYGDASVSVPINISTATTTKLFVGNGARAADITQINFQAAGADNVSLEYGTGTNCGTNTTPLTGTYTLTTGGFISLGDGFGSLFIVPAGNDVCLVTSGAVVLGGSISWNTQVGSL